MTLKEKFKNIVCNVEISNEKLINKSEQIADDYAVEFLDWVFGQPKFKVKHNSKRELLEIFKKEKGL
jgi:hypothetical protein